MVFLGLVPSQGSQLQQMEQLLAYRQLYFKKMSAITQFKTSMIKQ